VGDGSMRKLFLIFLITVIIITAVYLLKVEIYDSIILRTKARLSTTAYYALVGFLTVIYALGVIVYESKVRRETEEEDA
jgi:hypothetical protein